MDKKSKKRTVVLRERLQKVQRLLADAKRQMDDPAEVKILEQQMVAINAELATFCDR